MFSLRNEVIFSEWFRGTSLPRKLYDPPDGLSRADKQLSKVVFPEPDGPSRTTRSPSSISKLTPSNALTTPAGVS